ncbi:MAG: ribonuclease P protein component [Clostridiales bacterium]|nr:ribonuclease P protein component [Clostridiales bacterium]
MQKQYRLKKRAAFAYVYRKGDRAFAKDLLLLSARSREGLKIGLSVSKKVGNAVTRNRVKRLLREAISQIADRIDSSYMYVVVAYPSIVGLPLATVAEEVEAAYARAKKLKC